LAKAHRLRRRSNYILGDSIHHRDIYEDVGDFSVHGEPFDMWAGPVGLAFGAQYRKEKSVVSLIPSR